MITSSVPADTDRERNVDVKLFARRISFAQGEIGLLDLSTSAMKGLSVAFYRRMIAKPIRLPTMRETQLIRIIAFQLLEKIDLLCFLA